MGMPVPQEDITKIQTIDLDKEYNLPAGGAEKMFQLEKEHNLPTGILLATATNETGTQKDRANAVNPDSGAEGWMQFLPHIAKAYNVNPKDFDSSIKGAARMYSDLNKQYKGNVGLMLAAYNWGSGNITEQGIENAPPETKKYSSKAQEIMNRIKDIYYGVKSKLVPAHEISNIRLLTPTPHEGSTHDKGSSIDNPIVLAQGDALDSANRNAYFKATGERISGGGDKVPETQVENIIPETTPPGYISTKPSSNLSGLIQTKMKGGMSESEAKKWAADNGIK